jgi:AAA+ ATPase superfamily predicted ATPase
VKFYNRQTEIQELSNIYSQSTSESRMTVITGRRRVGKTMLALEFSREKRFVYLFVSRKAEHLLCVEYLEEIRKRFTLPVTGDIRSFRDIFTLLLDLSRRERFTLVIDEFQEFLNINPAVFSEIQKLWDLNRSQCRMNLICIGSIYSLMHRIFSEAKEPLFGRADRIITLKAFSISDIWTVLQDHECHDPQSLFAVYLLTGGMPKYLELLTANAALTRERILDFVLTANSPFINEGKNLLIEEFGKDYTIYFSILELIASGKTSRSEIESVLQIHAGAYLARLETDYAVLSRVKPIDAKPNARLQKYRIADNFLNFWFRFIFRNRSAVETENFDYIREVVDRDYDTYSGPILEKFYREIFAERKTYNRIGSSWEKGNKNEIDLIAVNDLEKKLVIAEVKLKRARIDLAALKARAEKLLSSYPGYHVEWLALGLEDIGAYVR